MTAEYPTTPGVTYKSIEGFPGYCVGDDGSVFSSNTRNGSALINNGWRDDGPWRPLVETKKMDGYPAVTLCCNGKRKERKIHRIVLEAFVGPRPEGMECLHKDGNPRNNCLDNLSWGTRKENGADKVRHGMSLVGSKNKQAKLDEKQVSEIKNLYRSGQFFQRELAAMYGVSGPQINAIVCGASWKHIT